MSLSEYTLDKEFDILATWFRVDESYENGVKGRVHYNNASIMLDLYDSFPDSTVERLKEINSLYGFSTKGEFLILNHCSHVSKDASSFGFAVESYSVETFYILDSKGEIPIENILSQVSRVQFSVDDLPSWMNTGLTTSLGDLKRSKTGRYFIQSQGLVLSTGVIHHRKKKKRTIVLEEHYFLEIADENSKSKSFDSLLEDAGLVKKLIEFLNSSPLQYDYIEFTTASVKGRYFFKQIKKQLPYLSQNKLTLDRIEKEFSYMLDQWFINENRFNLIINNYLNDLALDYSIETKLINSIRNLEVYYRNFLRNPHFIEERREALKADQQLLLTFVKCAVSEKNQQHFTQNILYVGEESLRVKLNDLIKNLPDQLFIACIKQKDKSPSKSRSAFINKLIDTRNYYTHGDEAEKYPDRVTALKDFLLINEKLKLIQRYYIYKELGLTEELILSILLPEVVATVQKYD